PGSPPSRCQIPGAPLGPPRRRAARVPGAVRSPGAPRVVWSPPWSPGCRSGGQAPWSSQRLQDRDDTLAAGSTDGDQAPRAGSLLGQHLGRRGDDPPAGRGEWVTRRQGGAVDVEPAPVDRAEGSIQSQPLGGELFTLPGGEGGEHGRGKGLV